MIAVPVVVPRSFARNFLVPLSLLSIACSDQTTTAARPRPSADRGAASQSASVVTPLVSVHWNEIARTLVASHNTNGPLASRAYALVSVAQLAAVSGATGPKHPSAQAAVARASWVVLSKLYPDPATTTLLAQALQSDEAAPDTPQTKHDDVVAGDALGAAVGQTVLTRAATDGAAAADCPATPPTPASQFWHDDANPPNPQPQLPCFGKVRPWLHIDITEFRASPPPAFGSAPFLAGLAEVRQISDTRTPSQLATVDKWLDGNNTFTPPGHWNLIASQLITSHHLNEDAAARVLAVLNIAMMDTHIACWDRKYTYWEIRPWQVDPLITTPRGQPHHPANPSGHACAGGAGSGVLAGLFPAERDSLLALGDEAGFTTVLSGVHYRFDVNDGTRIGRTIAARALDLHAHGAILALLADERNAGR